MKQALLGLGLFVTAAAGSPVDCPPAAIDGPRSAPPQ
jgi:hypothetical protein